jgi:hypothetical protein
MANERSCYPRETPAAAVPHGANRPEKENEMKTFVIERAVPNASALTDEQLREIATTSNAAVASLGRPYEWLHSYVAGDKIYCVHAADDAETIRDHARAGGFPADVVSELRTVFDGSWGAGA